MVDAVGGVAKIVGVALKIKEAANTVHQNKKDCHHIRSRVDILNRTLSHHEHNTELAEDSAVMAALEALDGILAEALEVISKCQEPRTIICVYCTAGNLSRQLSKVEQRISYLSTDVMLTIMSYQLLRKSQEGAPHPPLQMSKQNQDEANKKDPTRTSQAIPKFGDSDAEEAESDEDQTRFSDLAMPDFGSLKCGSRISWAPLSSDSQSGKRQRGKVRESTPDEDKYYGTLPYERRTEKASAQLGVIYHPQGPQPRLVHRIAEVTRNIKEAVGTVLQNKADCVEIGKCANKVSSLLPQLEDTKMTDKPAMRGALEKLLLTFHRAHTLVIACQRRGLVIAWLSTPAGRLSRQLHEVLDQIASNIADMTAIVLP